MGLRHLVCAIGALTVVSTGFPVVAAADPSDVIIDSEDARLSVVEAGGWTLTVTFTSFNTAELDVSGTIPAEPSCRTTLDPDELRPRQSTEIKVTIPNGCSLPPTGIVVEFTVTGSASAVDPFVVTAAAPSSPDTAWNWLWVFPAALVSTLVVAGLLRCFGRSRIVLTEDPFPRKLEAATALALEELRSGRRRPGRCWPDRGSAAVDDNMIALPGQAIRRAVNAAIGERWRQDPTYSESEELLSAGD